MARHLDEARRLFAALGVARHLARTEALAAQVHAADSPVIVRPRSLMPHMMYLVLCKTPTSGSIGPLRGTIRLSFSESAAELEEEESMRLQPFYSTRLGKAYLGDSLSIMAELPDASVNLIVTSPPFPLTFQKKKPYETVPIDRYVGWFLAYAEHFKRLLTSDGSFVLDLGGVWNRGHPTRSLYQYHLLIALCERLGYHFAQDFYWYNPGALPAPAEWVNVRRIRVKCAVNLVWWLAKAPWPKANNKNVLKKYSADMIRLIERGYRSKIRPSGHNITAKFRKNHGGAIPPNLLELGNNDSNGNYLRQCEAAGLPVHPARFPRGLPEFFIRLCSDPGDVVLDPFAGSNVTGEAAEHLDRRWLAVELSEEYLEGSKFRFERAPLRLIQARPGAGPS